jgi:hypothetical protein
LGLGSFKSVSKEIGGGGQLSEPFDALEAAFRPGVRSDLQERLEREVIEALGRLRHGRQPDAKGYWHGRREARSWADSAA